MKKKKWIVVLAAAVAAVAVGAAALSLSPMFSLGRDYQNMTKDGDDAVLATYKGQPVTRAEAAYHMSAQQGTITEREAVDDILLGMILLEEAERQGITVTEAEIEDYMAYHQSVYEEYPEAKELIDDFCAGADMTLEEYWAQLRQQSRDYLTRSKLRSAVAEGTIPVEGGEEVQSADGGGDAYERYCRQVLRAHQGDIVYP